MRAAQEDSGLLFGGVWLVLVLFEIMANIS